MWTTRWRSGQKINQHYIKAPTTAILLRLAIVIHKSCKCNYALSPFLILILNYGGVPQKYLQYTYIPSSFFGWSNVSLFIAFVITLPSPYQGQLFYYLQIGPAKIIPWTVGSYHKSGGWAICYFKQLIELTDGLFRVHMRSQGRG